MKKGILIIKFVLVLLICLVCVFVVYNSIPVGDKWLDDSVFDFLKDVKLNFIK